MIKEFKEFAFKGNLVDMAVGIVIGGAFGTVVKSLVADIVMPLIGAITNGIDFSDRFSILKEAKGKEGVEYVTAAAAKEAGATVMTWGNFVTASISFLIVAFVLFIVIKKFIGALEEKLGRPEEDDEKTPEPSDEVKLLTEIRDLMKSES